MSQAVDPRLAYAQGPAPAVTTAAPSEPEPQPSPSPNPSPTPPSPQPPVWGGNPDVGVSSSFLRGRADDCDTTSRLIRGTRGAAEDADSDLAKAAPGWAFAGSLADMQSRWELLLTFVTGRLDTAAQNFRDSADAYDRTEIATASQFAGPHTPHSFR
ncbi:hypothetical protein [Streptomyces sp. SLBN-31]|uniref:hypothetical protein n=1 Tax=Streptomyces sp. SLBN-31 TaxID=2768444 RepID=UPI0011516DDE|nr:hypothetical protein [Streptomyces sp. SLBN-31]TQJ75625.1 hypothetical protein FBY22_8674 [Streptomyces sp. SLBN-31]